MKSARFFIIIVILIAVPVVTLLLVGPLWFGYELREDVWGPAAAVAIFAGIFIAVGVIVWALERHKISQLSEHAGDVVLTLDGINTNGVWFGWNRGELGWRLRHIGRTFISVGPARSMEVLEFKCTRYDSHSLSRRAVKSWHVPIPRGKESEADRIIERLFATINFVPNDKRFEPSAPLIVRQDSEKTMLGHVFVGDVCRKCGNSVEAVLNFKWTCKE